MGPALRCCSLFLLFPPNLNRWSVVALVMVCVCVGGVMPAGNLLERVSGLSQKRIVGHFRNPMCRLAAVQPPEELTPREIEFEVFLLEKWTVG